MVAHREVRCHFFIKKREKNVSHMRYSRKKSIFAFIFENLIVYGT